MSSRYRSSYGGFRLGGGWTPAVKMLVIACTVGFVLDVLPGGPTLVSKFGLIPLSVTHSFYLWQLATYIFLHGGFFHILFNMFCLYMFGSELEATWGTRQFTKYFFLCGIGAGITSVVVSPNSPI